MRKPPESRQPDDTFESLWNDLFSSKTHLDSLLSRLPQKKKSVYAQILPRILAQPVSLARELGVGIRENEPWSLSADDLRNWPAAAQIATRLVAHLDRGLRKVSPLAEDFPANWKLPADLVVPLASPPPLSVRISRAIAPEAALNALRTEKDFSARGAPSALSPVGVRFDGYTSVLHSSLHEEGKLEIQDEGSQLMALFALQPDLVAPLLSQQPGKHPNAKAPALPKFPAWTVIDACAGAGGKSLAFADFLENRGRVFAYDVSEKKIQALRQRARRGQWSNLKASVVDPNDISALKSFAGTADRVLVDAPCSGWGVLRRNPDTKWREDLARLASFSEIQLRLLKQYSMLVKKGGLLTFGVCTFRPEETTAIVEAFESSEKGWKRLAGGYLGPDLTDGFFMTAWERQTE